MTDVKILIIGDLYDSADILAHHLNHIVRGMKAVAVGLEALRGNYIADGAFGIVIMDIHHATTDTIALCRELRTVFDGPAIIMCYENDERFLLDIYKEGIAEYITKPIGMQLFEAKVKAWMRHIDVHEQVDDGFEVDESRHLVTTPEGKTVRLPKLQFQLFDLLRRHRGLVLSTRVLVDRIYNEPYVDGETRVKNLVYQLRLKIEPDPSSPTYIETVAREGYRFQPVKKDQK